MEGGLIPTLIGLAMIAGTFAVAIIIAAKDEAGKNKKE